MMQVARGGGLKKGGRESPEKVRRAISRLQPTNLLLSSWGSLPREAGPCPSSPGRRRKAAAKNSVTASLAKDGLHPAGGSVKISEAVASDELEAAGTVGDHSFKTANAPHRPDRDPIC